MLTLYTCKSAIIGCLILSVTKHVTLFVRLCLKQRNRKTVYYRAYQGYLLNDTQTLFTSQ